MVNADGEVGFWDGHSWVGCEFRRWLHLLLNASPAATKCSVGEAWSGWVEAEKLVEDDLELGICESGFHEFDAVDVWKVRDVVEERWCGPAADLLMDLEGCSAARFQAFITNVVVRAPTLLRVLVRRAIASVERHGLFRVLALAVSANEGMRLVVQAPFHWCSRCRLLVRPVRRD